MISRWLAACLLLTTASPIAAAAQDAPPRILQLSFGPDGTVSLRAQNVTVRDILAEWKRQCGCVVVNAEKMPGGPLLMPLQYPNASQSAVLESLLRPAAGYVLTPRRPGSTSVSNFETIYILATSSPAAGYSATTSYTPVSTPMVTPGSPEDEIPPITPQAGPRPVPPNGPFPGGPMPNAPGTGQPAGPGGPGTPRPAAPGVFVPITPVIPPTPVVPGTPGAPNQSPMTPSSAPPAGRIGTGPFLTPGTP